MMSVLNTGEEAGCHDSADYEVVSRDADDRNCFASVQDMGNIVLVLGGLRGQTLG